MNTNNSNIYKWLTISIVSLDNNQLTLRNKNQTSKTHLGSVLFSSKQEIVYVHIIK